MMMKSSKDVEILDSRLDLTDTHYFLGSILNVNGRFS